MSRIPKIQSQLQSLRGQVCAQRERERERLLAHIFLFFYFFWSLPPNQLFPENIPRANQSKTITERKCASALQKWEAGGWGVGAVGGMHMGVHSSPMKGIN